MSGFVSFNCINFCNIHNSVALPECVLQIMYEMTKEELEFEVDMLSQNISVLIGLGYDAEESRKKLTEYREKLLLLTRTENNANQAE